MHLPFAPWEREANVNDVFIINKEYLRMFRSIMCQLVVTKCSIQLGKHPYYDYYAFVDDLA